MELNRDAIAGFIRRLPADEPVCAYIYDLDALSWHASGLAASLPENCELFYAVKANSDLPVLHTLALSVSGFEVASGGELSWIRTYFPDIPVIFGGPGKADKELRNALYEKVDCIHVESLSELERLAWIAHQSGTTAQILLRVNLPLVAGFDSALALSGRVSQFGIEAAQLSGCLAWLESHPEINLRGFQFHLLSHQLEAARHLNLLDIYFTQLRQWREAFGVRAAQINVGGVGTNYCEPSQQYDWPTFVSGMVRLIREHGLERDTIRLELGPYMTADCGYYAMEVLDIKRCFGRNFVIGRGGTHHFRTPDAQEHSHPFFTVPRDHWSYPFSRREIEATEVTVAGQLCAPTDILATNISVKRLRIGDVIVFPYAGAHDWYVSDHDFLRHPHPAHFYLPVGEPLHAANQ